MLMIVETACKGNAPSRAKRAAATRTVASKIASNTVRTKVKALQNTQVQDDNKITEKGKEKRLHGNNVHRTDLPAFTSKKWRDTFLPALYDRLYTSSDPFGDFSVGTPVFVKILQEIVEVVYPDVEYIVTPSDSIHFLAYNRINEKRSNIGSSAIQQLETHIKTLDGEKAVKEWLRWCIWPGSSLLFQLPSPIRYIEPPEGRLLSPFVIALAKPHLKLAAKSTSENGLPQGLIALIAAALERAARHLYNPKVKLAEFSKTIWGAHVEAYWKSFQPDTKTGNEGVEPERWVELVKRCLKDLEAAESDEDMFDADLSILDDKRPLIFNFRSPSKSRR